MSEKFRKSTQLFFVLGLVVIVASLIIPSIASAATTGSEFESIYKFVYGAATGYLGRSIAIVGGLIGLGFGAAAGRALPAITGVMLAIFGSLGPSIINTVFGGAII